MQLLLAAAALAMQLHAGNFVAGARLPGALMAQGCGGQNRTPVLSWDNPPKATASFALVVHDPDAPVPGGFYHWVVYDLPARARGLPSSPALRPEQIGVASTGKAAYDGPCPPPGSPHHYTFTLYALDLARVGGTAPLTGAQLEQRVRGHVLARAVLTATASNHS